MERLAVVSDTHIPSRASELPDFVAVEMEDADLVVHAGDFDSVEAYELVRDVAGDDFVAVAGNMDPTSLGLPRVETLYAEDRQFVVTHGTGPLNGYADRVAETVRDRRDEADAVGISGHTHELADREVDGVRLLNPGTATGARPAAEPSMLLVDVDGRNVEVTERWA